jgi:hypothetical protein
MFMMFPQGPFIVVLLSFGCGSRSAGRSGAAGIIGTLAHLASQPFFAVPAFAESPLRCCETSGKMNFTMSDVRMTASGAMRPIRQCAVLNGFCWQVLLARSLGNGPIDS